MSSTPRIYLDNAATSWPKPEAVYNAIDHYQRNIGAAAGRGAYCQAQQAQQAQQQNQYQHVQFQTISPKHGL